MADKGGRRRQRGRVLALHRAIKKADEEKIEGESSNQKLIPVALASLRFSVCSYAERRQRQRQTTVARGHVGRRDALREKKQPQGEKVASDVGRQIRQADVMLKSAVLLTKR